MQPGATPQSVAQAEALARLQSDDTPPNQAHYLTNKSASTVPKRTKSRFREDLPEFPLSPPDSRVQSPEADAPTLPVVAEKYPHMVSRLTPPPGQDASSCAEQLKATARNETHLSMSLASIDSEGSWLSGRVGSLRAPKKQGSLARMNRRDTAHPSDSPTNSTREDLSMADYDLLSHFATGRHPGVMAGQGASGEGCLNSVRDESPANDHLKWGRVGAKPEVTQYHHHDRETVRSRQGLLNIDSEDEEDTRMLTPTCSV